MAGAELCPHLRANTRKLIALMLCLCLLTPLVTVRAQKGQKSYKQGLKYESAQQWEQAAEAFALAVAAEPSNVEIQLHYRRALFNASQSCTQKGRALMEQGDYLGAYNYLRHASGYDSTNSLALALMERALRLQLDKDEARGIASTATGSLVRGATVIDSAQVAPGRPELDNRVPELSKPTTRPESLPVITYNGDLEEFIRFLARQLGLNAIFDRDFPQRNVKVELRDVTAAQALDYIFLSQGVFFQKLNRRTFLVSAGDQSKRLQYQQLGLRTFYLANINPEDARSIIMAAIPAQIGRTPIAIANKSTNSLTVRDTPENIRLIAEILRSIDKERAEVVMDVNIYEVSRSALLEVGNQFGTEATLGNLGGIQKGFSILAGSREVVTQGVGAVTAPTALGAALILPASTLAAIQRKDQTRLIASTQVHAFDGELSTAHIGQRVPIQTASVTPFGGVSADAKNPASNVNSGVFGGSGFPVIQYEKTGLTLQFTPQVFSNFDVQVKMNITSNEVQNANSASLTPSFTERNIEGTARIQNNRTMMIASVAQNQQSSGRVGLPLLGLIPIFGRLFNAPRHNNQQTDIVIAVTPHVLRAPSVTPGDEQMHPSGTQQLPATDTVAAMLQDLEHEDQLLAARQPPATVPAQIPEPQTSSLNYVPAPRILLTNDIPQHSRIPVETSAKNPAIVAPTSAARNMADAAYVESASRPRATSAAQLRFFSDRQELRPGARQSLKLFLKTDAPLGLLTTLLKFDPRVIAVRSISPGSLSASGAKAPLLTQSIDPQGRVFVSLLSATGAQPMTGVGVLLTIEVEALAAGESTLNLDSQDVHVTTADGRRVLVQVVPLRLIVK